MRNPGEPPLWRPEGLDFRLRPPAHYDALSLHDWERDATRALSVAVEQALGRWPDRAKSVGKAVLDQLPAYLATLRAHSVARAAYDQAWSQYRIACDTPCPHGASFDDLRQALPIPVHHKRPKHLRDYLQWAITLDFVRAEIVNGEARYFLAERAALFDLRIDVDG